MVNVILFINWLNNTLKCSEHSKVLQRQFNCFLCFCTGPVNLNITRSFIGFHFLQVLVYTRCISLSASLSEDSHLLVEANGILFECEDIVCEDHDLVVAALVEADQELAGTELVGVHGVQQDPFPRLDGHILAEKLGGHWAPHLGFRVGETDSQTFTTGNAVFTGRLFRGLF